MPVQPPPERNPIKPIRWCDVDDEMENDPLVNLEIWKMGVSQNTESSYNDVFTVERVANLRGGKCALRDKLFEKRLM